jgi:hypothetical protein
MSSSGTGNRTICFIRTDDAVPFVTEGVESNVFAAYMAALAETLELGDESDASKLRHGCKTVMINETSCLESTPVFNEEEAPENIDDALRIHASAEYIRLIGEQCVDRTSGPASLQMPRLTHPTKRQTRTTTSTAPRITASTRPTSPGMAQAGSWRRSPGPAPRQWRCILLAPVLLSFGL